MPSKFHSAVWLVTALSFSSAALAQSNNPFQKPSATNVTPVNKPPAGAPAPGGATPNGSPVGGPIGSMPSQPGGMVKPGGSISSGPATPEVSVVDEFMKAGGIFIGCVRSKPLFATKSGQRAYFNAKDLRKSHEARHLVRC